MWLVNSSTLAKISEHTAPVRSAKNLSTMFSQDAEVGVKCMWKRFFCKSHFCTFWCLWVA